MDKNIFNSMYLKAKAVSAFPPFSALSAFLHRLLAFCAETKISSGSRIIHSQGQSVDKNSFFSKLEIAPILGIYSFGVDFLIPYLYLKIKAVSAFLTRSTPAVSLAWLLYSFQGRSLYPFSLLKAKAASAFSPQIDTSAFPAQYPSSLC
jgi:hypothetical protein